MYKIVIEDLTFKAILGVLEKERNEEQLVVVCAKIEYEDKKNFVDYAKVCEIIEDTIKKGKFILIEDAIDVLVEKIKTAYPQIKSIYLKIRKPEILKNALVGVEILRNF
jgi:dihydroneopterin aldolase